MTWFAHNATDGILFWAFFCFCIFCIVFESDLKLLATRRMPGEVCVCVCVNILLIYSFDCIDPGQNHNDHCWDFTSIMHLYF